MEEIEVKEEKSGITLPVFIVSLVSFLNDVASDMVYPIIPVFLTTVLGAPIAVVGLIEGIAESTASFLKVVSGIWSDKLRLRKPFIVAGYVLSASSKGFYAFASTWMTVLVGKFSDRLGKGTRTAARDAYIAEHTAAKDRGKAFGFHRGMDTLGAVVGPLLGILLLQRYGEDFHKIFLISLIPTAIAVVLLILFLKEKKKDNGEKKEEIKLGALLRNMPKPLIIFLVINFIFAVGNSSDAFLILRARDLGLTLISTVLAYALFNMFYATLSVPAGILSDRIGPRNILVTGLIIFAAVYLFFGYATSSLYVWVLFPIYGIYMALTDGVSKAYISHIIPEEALGTAYGLYQFAIGVAAFIASVLAGLLWTSFGEQAPFIFGGVMALIAALLLLLIGPKGKTITTSYEI